MYNEDFKISAKAANKTRAVINAAIAYNEAKNAPVTESKVQAYSAERLAIAENLQHKKAIRDRYISFAETVRSTLLTEALYRVYKESTEPFLLKDPANCSIMRSIVSEYVRENTYYDIMNKMKKGSVFTSQIHNIINEYTEKILESVDKEDPSTFTITPDMKDEFFKQLDYSDSEAVSDAIKARVSDAVEDFVSANAKDHEDINAALKSAQEKIDSAPDGNTDIRESYDMKARRRVTEIRTAPKSVFHKMVSAVCESTLKHPKEMVEFMSEGHLNLDKIVDRVNLMYTFMETLNTARVEKIDENYLENMIINLKQ